MPDPERPGDCVFCQIVDGEIPAEIVHTGETTVAFRDLDPQAPTHVLIVPRSHYTNAAELARHEPASVAALVGAGSEIAAAEGLDAGYRLVFNTGVGAGQTVFHAHLHLLGGRTLQGHLA